MAALNLEQQREAADLYISGLSAQQVANHFDVSIDAAYYTLRHLGISRRTAAETNRIRYEKEPLSYSIKTILTEGEERLKLAALISYWAEGYKLGNSIDFCNSDPDMVVLFKRFLTEICGVDESRLRCFVYGYVGQDIAALTEFWSSLLSIPETQFTKPYIKQAAPGPQGPRMIHGLVHVRYCDTKLLRQILVWIDEYRAECVGGRVVNCTSL
jgi:hypothetical protein